MPNWFIHEFDPDVVEKIKDRTVSKNLKFNYNNYKNNAQTRWVGTMGELAFEEFLQSQHLKYKYWALPDRKDDRDFTVGPYECDVKTVGCKTMPQQVYEAQVVEDQFDRAMRSNYINAFVFCRFVIPLNLGIVLGWLPKTEFKEKAKFREAGSKAFTSTGRLSTSQWEVPIGYLREFKIK